ncbi:hypothetical protein DUNSADRAFT_15600 [Dunaliella salina]|uniref:Methyl-accepting transducer domain-containing protein n=1 Tax=Dunaliella salina TaxID=3046 RepID=A0ABQ7H1L3_DUNSA|nr:hypothetical protein DUNSADRAFT_15600 [Dunaliella salina]|eukprot:KAF5840743.1 hypothetical protein DUNSADRAFT_15600 [Dunaliella salina]
MWILLQAQAKQEERERKRSGSREAAQKEDEARMLHIGKLQADIDKLKRQVESAERNTESMLESRVAGQKASIAAGLEQQMQAVVMELRKDMDSVRSQMQSSVAGLRGELEQDVACIRAESSASASSVEASAMAANSVAMKLRNHMQACSTADAATAAKIEGLERTMTALSTSMSNSAEGMTDTINRSVDGLSSAITRLGDDAKKVKKHVVKLERAVEGLQSLGHVGVAADKALQEVKHGSDHTAASVSVLMTQSKEAAQAVQSTLARIAELEARMASATDAHTRIEEAAQAVQSMLSRIAKAEAQLATATDACSSNRKDIQEAAQAVQSTLVHIAEVEAQTATATDMCSSNRKDIGDMAESLGAAFQQVNEGTRKGLQQQAQQCQQLYHCLQQLQQQILQQQQQQPASYLQSLLGPGPLSSTSAMSMARMQLLGGQAAPPVAISAMPNLGESPQWEPKPTEFDSFLKQFRSRSHTESSRPLLRSESPVQNGRSRHRHS